MSFTIVHTGAVFICSDSAVHLYVDENRYDSLEGSNRHEGVHTRADHPGDCQHPQPVGEEHGQHGSHANAG